MAVTAMTSQLTHYGKFLRIRKTTNMEPYH